jgi:hypothetical protein
VEETSFIGIREVIRERFHQRLEPKGIRGRMASRKKKNRPYFHTIG